MFPRDYTSAVPPAGIKTKSGESAAKCFRIDDTYRGTDTQMLYRNHKLGDPGSRLHTPGFIDPDPPSNISFGKPTDDRNYSTSDCLHIDPTNVSDPYKTYLDAQEKQYHRSKHKLGQVPDGVAEIPLGLLKTGFGISTKFGESVGAIVQGTHTDVPNDERLHTGYQTHRDYNWDSARINPVTHTFGDKCSGNIDHLNELMNYDDQTHVIPTAVERAEKNAIVRDPDPINPAPGIRARTMRAHEVLQKRDPAERAPAGLCTQASEFTIGDTISEMGCMDSIDPDYHPTMRDYNPADDISHGVPTKPNPFPNPLRGPGKYANLGLSDEDFLKLRDKKHIVPIMVQALALTEQEASDIFDSVANREHRNLVSVSEFHQAFKQWH